MRISHEAIYQALYMNENTMAFYDNTVQKVQTCPGGALGKSKPLLIR